MTASAGKSDSKIEAYGTKFKLAKSRRSYNATVTQGKVEQDMPLVCKRFSDRTCGAAGRPVKLTRPVS